MFGHYSDTTKFCEKKNEKFTAKPPKFFRGRARRSDTIRIRQNFAKKNPKNLHRNDRIFSWKCATFEYDKILQKKKKTKIRIFFLKNFNKLILKIERTRRHGSNESTRISPPTTFNKSKFHSPKIFLLCKILAPPRPHPRCNEITFQFRMGNAYT